MTKKKINHSQDVETVKIALEDSRYPSRVKHVLGSKSPHHLYMRGNLDLLDDMGIGFCGSRKVSDKGLDVARDCAGQVQENHMVVISGNASGVDCAVHHTALVNGGRTIFVLPEGIDHFRVRKDLRPVWDWSRVLVISHFDPNHRWQIYRAMQRNSLIIALSSAMILIEAGEKGGSLAAGLSTLKMNIPLFVVAYEDMSESGQGNAILLHKGAQKLSKSRSLARASMDNIFASVREGFSPQHPLQPSLL